MEQLNGYESYSICSFDSSAQTVVDADLVNSFKNRLDEFDKYFINV